MYANDNICIQKKLLRSCLSWVGNPNQTFFCRLYLRSATPQLCLLGEFLLPLLGCCILLISLWVVEKNYKKFDHNKMFIFEDMLQLYKLSIGTIIIEKRLAESSRMTKISSRIKAGIFSLVSLLNIYVG